MMSAASKKKGTMNMTRKCAADSGSCTVVDVIFLTQFVSVFVERVFVFFSFLEPVGHCFLASFQFYFGKITWLELELVCGALVVEHRKWGSGQLGFPRFWLSFFILFATRSVVTFLLFVGVLVLVWFVTQQHVESCKTDSEFWRIVVYDGLPNHCCM